MLSMPRFDAISAELRVQPKIWLVTGVAGFVGSNLLECLLSLDQKVVGLDNLSTGSEKNLVEVKAAVGSYAWSNFRFMSGDITSVKDCQAACVGVDHVLHQAALGSVPRSLENPIGTNSANIDGFLNIMVSARDAGVDSFTYAASSSTYGDHKDLPKVEGRIGNPLSPYAVTKLVNELYADVFARCYEFKTIGLRYFNVYGKRQSPEGAYAAVIPKWVDAMIAGRSIYINGDGETSRDFCHITNVVQANILAATAGEHAKGAVYNVACNDRTSLNELLILLKQLLRAAGIYYELEPIYQEPRPGDVRHSQADISKIKSELGYEVSARIRTGLEIAIPWYVANLSGE